MNLLTTKPKKPLQIKNCETCLAKIGENSGRVLLAAVHQDDDVFIVSRLQQHLEIGDEIFVVWTTSAKRRGIKHEQKRINESKNAMKFLGINPRNCFYLQYPERETFRYMGEIITHLKKIIKQIQPGLIYIPAYEGGHIDHDVTHYSVVRSIQELEYNLAIYEFPLYNAYKTFFILPFRMRNLTPNPGTHCRILSEEEYKFVKKYWSIYKSQHFPLGIYMSLLGGKRKIFGVEYIRELPEYDYLAPPCQDEIAYQRFLKVRFSNFKNAVLLNKDRNH